MFVASSLKFVVYVYIIYSIIQNECVLYEYRIQREKKLTFSSTHFIFSLLLYMEHEVFIQHQVQGSI